MSVATDDSADTDTSTGNAVQHKRATVRPDKADAVAELVEAFRGASAAVLTEYRGLTVKQISELRTALGADTSYAVVKNTLTKIAAADAGISGVDELLSGPTAVAFVQGEPVEAAKALRDFARAHPALVVKGGVMDGKTLTVDEVRKLADLESREVLLAKMAGALLASLSNAVYLLNAPLAQAARLAGALQAKATEDPSVIGGAGTQAPDLVEAALAAEESVSESSGDTAPDTSADSSGDGAADQAPDDVVAGTAAGPATEPAVDTADDAGSDSGESTDSTPDSDTPA